MKRRILALLLCCALCLAGCGNLFDQDYLSVTDYEPPVQEAPDTEGVITVRNASELSRAISGLINDGAEEGHVVFDAAYEGDVNADIASSCWQVRTRNALFAYCVENISYDVSKIVSHYEASLSIRYTEAGLDRDSIVRLQLTSGLEEQLRSAVARGDSRLVVLISRSAYSAEDVENLAQRVYRENPAVQPREPRVNVNMLIGTGMQRLYEVNFNYGMNAEELEARREALQALDPFGETELQADDYTGRALAACSYLVENCVYSESGQSDIYSALIGGEANSEGLALAYVELCRQLGISCQIVYGQRDWQDCCWNIIRIGEDYYHVDVSVCADEGMALGFLLPDQTMWSRYRWDISSYPPCSGWIRYEDLVPQQETEPDVVEVP
jgi:transglutaminase/protease-like cytokinesis protein 3